MKMNYTHLRLNIEQIDLTVCAFFSSKQSFSVHRARTYYFWRYFFVSIEKSPTSNYATNGIQQIIIHALQRCEYIHNIIIIIYKESKLNVA